MIVVFLFLLGLCLGSFVNALVWRLHEQSRVLKKSKTRHSSLVTQDLSILKGRSMCPHCKHILAWGDLLPVFSWLQLAGKCRYCKKAIHWQYPLVELLTAALFALSFAVMQPIFHLPSSIFQFALWLGLLTLFVAMAVYDLRWMLLPDKLTRVATALAVLLVVVRIFDDGVNGGSLINLSLGVLCIAGLFYILFQVSKGKWIGGGDVKLGVSLGIVAGSPAHALLVIFLASLSGSIVGVPLLLKGGKNKKRIPFGPFLISSTVLVFLFGDRLIEWYLHTIGL